MSDVGKEEDGDAEELEGGVRGVGLAVGEGELVRRKYPVRMIEEAGGDGAVVDDVVGGAVLDDEATLEEEGIGCDVSGALGRGRFGGVKADGADDVVEAALAGADVVVGVGGLNLFIVVAAGKADVACGDGVSGVGVVSDGVGAEGVVLIGDEDVAGEDVGRVVLGLGVGLEDGAVRTDIGREWDGAGDGAEVFRGGLRGG
jgi:hypothetical protein